MKFFLIEDIAEQFQDNESRPITIAEITRLIKLIKSSSTYEEPEIKEMAEFLEHINSPMHLVFYSWIIDANEIKSALIYKQLLNVDLSKKAFYKHTERENFYHFLSLFLTHILEQKMTTEKLSEMYSILLYSQMISEKNRLFIQAQMKSKIERILEVIFLKEDVSIAFNVKFIELLNLFDRSFYTIRSGYIKVISQLLLDENLSITEKQKIATASRRVDLNEDHRMELNTFIKKAGLNQLRKGGVSSLIKRILTLFILLLVALVTYFLSGNNFSQTDDTLTIIPPYGTDSLNIEQIDYLNELFRLELDTINEGSTTIGLDMESFLEDTLK
jgi:hypothetical protein